MDTYRYIICIYTHTHTHIYIYIYTYRFFPTVAGWRECQKFSHSPLPRTKSQSPSHH